MKLTVGGKSITVSARDAIGKGGEADVYDLGNGQALKVFKGPHDADYVGDPVAQEGARIRLAEQQTKLPAFPSSRVPPNVVAPLGIALNGTGKVAGYTMKYLKGMEVLLRYSDRRFREQGGVDPNDVIRILENLADVVDQVHHEQIVIGDFNDLNVLTDGTKTYLIDADSFQFGGFDSHTFTSRFLDPLISAPDKLTMVKRPGILTDWYSYSVILFQSLLYTGPYGGVHRPKGSRPLQHDQRVLSRITVFSSDVIYPRPAIPYGYLPDEILEHFHLLFEKDRREVLRLGMLSAIEWTTCSNCRTVHARPVCPACATYVRREPVVVRGNVTAKRVFVTEGTIVCTAYQGGKLRYIYHDGERLQRESGPRQLAVTKSRLDPQVRYRVSGDLTILASRHRALTLPEAIPTDIDAYGRLPMIDANSKNWFWITPDGCLVRSDPISPRYIGSVLPGRTLFWTGEHFGFGFYRAGNLMRAFVFSDKGMNDQVEIPDFRGELVDTTCIFSEDYAWFFATLQDNGRLINHVYVVENVGELVGHYMVDQTEDNWLATGIRGRFATGRSLFVPTDTGVVRVDRDDLSRVAKSFPDTQPFVDSTSQLLSGDGGIYVVNTNEITLLTIS